MSASVQDVAEKIATLIQQSPTKTLLGSSLIPILRLSFPGFKPVDYGSANLRHFVRANVPTVREVSLQGVDIVYGLQSTPNTTSAPLSVEEENSSKSNKARRGLQIAPRVWKTFASPSERYQLFGNQLSGELRVVEQGELSPGSPWTRIPSCSPEEHLGIAKDFISVLQDEEHKNSLLSTLDKPGWWNIFLFTAQRLGLATRWHEHRQRRLHEQFLNTIQRKGIPLPKQRGRTAASSPVDKSSSTVSHANSAHIYGPGESLRRIVIGAINRMSVSELRSLNIPIGHIIDELKAD
ncbi:MAG: hypothetical protein F4Z14_08520 [Gammaproteobacteria bacterium]|nr:hypothetical protein [Gammaproteobacteria bacterium]